MHDTIEGTDVPTRAALAAQLTGAGVTGPALEVVLNGTTRSRQLARVAAVVESFGDPATTTMVAILDAVGVGGRLGLGRGGWSTPATCRHPLLRDLGTGRKHALDGGAWSAAITEARQQARRGLAEATGGEYSMYSLPITLSARSEGVLLEAGGVKYPFTLGEDVLPAEWARSLAGQYLLRQAGETDFLPESWLGSSERVIWQGVDLLGTRSDWATLFNAAQVALNEG